VKSVVVGTAGHIDHGKSALVMALTGTDPDRLKEEKARGITIDLGFAHADLGDVKVAFVDVPGHERFVKNMLAGVGGIDLVLLVVAADESVMPQTREHFDICKLLQIPAGVIVLTKSDLADAETRELAAIEVRELVAGSFLEGAPLVTVSARTGEGLDELRRALQHAASAAKGRSTDGPARLPIDRVFSVRGFGTVVTGTLVSGRIRSEDRLVILPSAASGRPVGVRGVQVHGSRKEEAIAGQRAAVNVANLEVGDLERGQELVTPGAFESTALADASLELLPGARPLRHGARVRFHQGTSEIIGRVAVVGPANGGAAPTIAPGGHGFVRLRLERPTVLTRHDRYILRAYSPPMTIAGGEILDPAPPRAAIRTAAALERSRELAARDDGDVPAISRMIEEAGRRAFPMPALVSRAGVPPQEVDRCAAALLATKRIERVADVLVSRRLVDDLKTSLVDALTAHHRAQPLSEGVSREEARERLFRRGHPDVFEHVVDDLVRSGTVAGRDRLSLARHHVALSPGEEQARDAIETALRAGGLTPPDVAAIVAQHRLAAAVAERVVHVLVKQKRLVRIETLIFHEEVLRSLKNQISALKAGGESKIDVAMFKERFGVTRKFAIPLLEYLDRERLTRRVGESRVIL
jgi:selenocysteine-specific elongation factor